MSALIAKGINAYFEEVRSLLKKIFELRQTSELDGFQYKRIVMPALYALIECIACSRYGSLSSGARFKALLKNYSGQKEELDKVDVVFLYQWNDSEQVRKKAYKDAIESVHPQVKSALVKVYGKEKNIHINMDDEKRFREKGDLYQQMLDKGAPQELLELSLDLFSRCSVIYLYGRCSVIHQGDFSSRGFIDIKYLFQLLGKIIVNLEAECQSKQMLPWQLV